MYISWKRKVNFNVQFYDRFVQLTVIKFMVSAFCGVI